MEGYRTTPSLSAQRRMKILYYYGKLFSYFQEKTFTSPLPNGKTRKGAFPPVAGWEIEQTGRPNSGEPDQAAATRYPPPLPHRAGQETDPAASPSGRGKRVPHDKWSWCGPPLVTSAPWDLRNLAPIHASRSHVPAIATRRRISFPSVRFPGGGAPPMS